MYKQGKHVEQNYTIAFNLHILGTTIGSNLEPNTHRALLTSTSDYYFNGFGVEKNYYIAYRLYLFVLDKYFNIIPIDILNIIMENKKFIEDNYPNIQVDYANTPVLK